MLTVRCAPNVKKSIARNVTVGAGLLMMSGIDHPIANAGNVIQSNPTVQKYEGQGLQTLSDYTAKHPVGMASTGG